MLSWTFISRLIIIGYSHKNWIWQPELSPFVAYSFCFQFIRHKSHLLTEMLQRLRQRRWTDGWGSRPDHCSFHPASWFHTAVCEAQVCLVSHLNPSFFFLTRTQPQLCLPQHWFHILLHVPPDVSGSYLEYLWSFQFHHFTFSANRSLLIDLISVLSHCCHAGEWTVYDDMANKPWDKSVKRVWLVVSQYAAVQHAISVSQHISYS